LVEHLHGKEGVDGSSPSEGFANSLHLRLFRCRQGRRERASASRERPRAGDFSFDEALYCCAEDVCAASVRRPPSVHGPLGRELIEQRDRMRMAVAGQVAVVAVDHRDARADEARDREHRNAGAEGE